jgi:IclR family acetate operon transcriptional repressor
VHSISAPVWLDGRVRVALSLTAPTERFRAHEAEYVAALLDCATLS